MRVVGRIDRRMFAKLTPDITTDEVIITDERISHSNLHDHAYDRFAGFIPEVLHDPDFIFQDSRPYTAVLIREINADGKSIQMVVRLHVPNDYPAYKNSIISFWEISRRRRTNYEKNKKIVYRRGDI